MNRGLIIMTIMSPSLRWMLATGENFQNFSTTEIRTLIAEHLGVDIERVTDDAHFIGDLGADWLDHLELMIVIEDRFSGLEITEDDVNHIEVVGDLIRYIETWVNRGQKR